MIYELHSDIFPDQVAKGDLIYMVGLEGCPDNALLLVESDPELYDVDGFKEVRMKVAQYAELIEFDHDERVSVLRLKEESA